MENLEKQKILKSYNKKLKTICSLHYNYKSNTEEDILEFLDRTKIV